MIDLTRAVEGLVAAATTQVDPRALKSVVEKVLDGFGSAPEREQNAALRALGRALGDVDGRGAQILSLALGALVEGGASAEIAWPAVSQDLAGLLDAATAFASAAVKHAKDHHLDVAIERSGAAVAKKHPREAEAWKAAPSRCLAAVACLTSSKKLRSRVRKDTSLAEACWSLSDAVTEVGLLLQALRIVDDETFLVLAPDARRGWCVEVDALPSNAELYILLADAIVGDPKKGRIAGKRPDPRAVTAIREGTHPPKSASSVIVPFHLLAWTALQPDGSLPVPHSDAHMAHLGDPEETDHALPMEGLPADIPSGPGKERVLLVQAAPDSHPIPVAPAFESLRSELRIVAELSADEVSRKLARLVKAVGGTAPAKRTAASAKRAAAKTTSKSKTTSSKSKTASSKSKTASSKSTPKKAASPQRRAKA